MLCLLHPFYICWGCSQVLSRTFRENLKFTKGDYQVSLVRYHLILQRVHILLKEKTTSAGTNVKRKGLSFTIGGCADISSIFEKQHEQFLQSYKLNFYMT